MRLAAAAPPCGLAAARGVSQRCAAAQPLAFCPPASATCRRQSTVLLAQPAVGRPYRAPRCVRRGRAHDAAGRRKYFAPGRWRRRPTRGTPPHPCRAHEPAFDASRPCARALPQEAHRPRWRPPRAHRRPRRVAGCRRRAIQTASARCASGVLCASGGGDPSRMELLTRGGLLRRPTVPQTRASRWRRTWPSSCATTRPTA